MKQSRWKLRGLGLLGLALLWTFVGCATVEEKFDKFVDYIPEKLTSWTKPAPQKPTYYKHKVRYPGETLSIISEWYTGDAENWRALAKANKKLNPNHISIGTKIRIPKKLLRTTKRMPRDFVEVVEMRQKTKRERLAKAKAPPRAKPARRRTAYYYHRVRYSGETLSVIARWYTGDAENWRTLTKANPDLDPNHIFVGAKIRIPKRLLHTGKPMPRDFILLSAPAREVKPSPTATSLAETLEKQAQPSSAAAETKELELFGPK
jgi:LysM repeat protein